jgi:protein-S-isoprenylcysteine O-methyltransferase Ste14
MRHLNLKAFAGLLHLLVVLGLALFLPAWTLRYWQAWTFLAVFGACVTGITVELMRHDRALLERRVRVGPTAEVRPSQKLVQSLASLIFLALFVVPATDHRLGWSSAPTLVVVAGDLLVAVGLWIVFRVFRANSFTAATIEIGSEQRVVSSGPYACVRHPMYAGALVMLLGVPLALGSWWGLVAWPPMTAAIVFRLLDEERLLASELAGYAAYRAKVRRRLVPGVW